MEAVTSSSNDSDFNSNSDSDSDSNSKSDSESRGREIKRLKLSVGKEKALEDRISGLPNSLLLQILSLLEVIDAASTSFLSKRWRGLWASIPILNFDHCNTSEQFYDYGGSVKGLRLFVSFINRAMILYQSPKMVEFNVNLEYMKSFSSDVDVWLQLATRKNVEVLDLGFIEFNSNYYEDASEEDADETGFYVLPKYVLSNSSLVTLKLWRCVIRHLGPQYVLSNSSLVTLRLTHCIIRHSWPINWKSLKVLSLTFMSLSNDLIRDILSGSPSLEVLELHYCSHYDVIDIKSKRLRKLVIHDHNIDNHLDLGNINALRISAPNVKLLEISGGLRTLKFSLISSSSVVDANINFSMPSDHPHFEGFCKEYPNIMKELLEKIHHVKDLHVGSFCLQALSLLEEKQLPSPLSNLVCLSIGTELNEWELPGISRFLTLTPLLETLVIDMACLGYSGLVFGPKFLESLDIDRGNYWSSQKSVLALMLKNLKTVKFVGFKGSEKEIEVILFMLENAQRLEKMIIQRRKLESAQLEEPLRVAERLLSFPRCSPVAVILFSELLEDT